MKKNNFIPRFLVVLIFVLACCTCLKSAATGLNFFPFSSPKQESTLTINDPQLWQKTPELIWSSLQHTPQALLETAQNTNTDPSVAAWLKLAIISKEYSTNTFQLVRELLNWRNNNPNHSGNEIIPNDGTLDLLLSSSSPKHIVVLLPLHGPQAKAGRLVRKGFLGAYYSSLAQTSEKQVLSFYDTSRTTNMASLYEKAVENGADLVVGPLLKADVENLNKYKNFTVPVLALNYTQPSFFSSISANFYEFGLAPAEEARQMANKAWAQGFKQALIIAPDNSWGKRVAEAAALNWENLGGNIADRLYFGTQFNLTKNIADLLHVNPKTDRELMKQDNKKSVLTEQRRQDFDVIFLFAQPDTARQIVPLLSYYYASKIPIYSISTIYSGRPNPQKDKDLEGVNFSLTPWALQNAHASTIARGTQDNLYAVGQDAYLLSQTLTRLNLLPNFPIYGATGVLSANEQQIHQRLPWVTMHGGLI